MNYPIERRAFAAHELRSGAGDSMTIAGYAAVFNQWSEPLGGGQFVMREKIAPGAFAESLRAGTDIHALWSHDYSSLIGRTTAGTLRLNEDAKGLRFECDLPDTTLARDLVENIRRGNLSQMSFGFNVLDDEFDYDYDKDIVYRTLRSVKLYEISIVARPAYPQTSVVLRIADKAMQRAGTFRDDERERMRMRLRIAEVEL